MKNQLLRLGLATLATVVVLAPGTGCSISSLGSIFGKFSLFSLFPGEPGPEGPSGSTGPQGPTGTPGADGSLRIYGDGSAGDVVVDGNMELEDIAPDRNTQFRKVTIEVTGTLAVPTGAVLRCSESFTNRGAVVVRFAEIQVNSSSADPGQGVSHQSASPGESGDGSVSRVGGRNGTGVSEGEAAFILTSDPRGGGAGSNSPAETFNRGGRGGGRLIVLARDSITNIGSINAPGEDGAFAGSGGGGAGIIVLASKGSVTNTGALNVDGGDGGDGASLANSNHAGGGGGGGGIIHLLAPSVSHTGTIDHDGGEGGADGGIGNDEIRAGGGGGGACGGDGGGGGTAINAPVNELRNGVDGDPGYFFMTIVDPTALF